MSSPAPGPVSSQDQVARLEAEVESLRCELRRAQQLASVGTLAAMVAHEFNNILTPIISYAQLAQRNPAFAEKAIARAADGGHRATTICQALLGMAADGPPAIEPIRLIDLARSTLDAMAREPGKDMIDLALDIPEDLILHTRRVELQHVLLNLLLNARSAVLKRPAGRKIELAARTTDDGCQIEVRDNGPGIPPELKNRIFDAFFTTRGGSGPTPGKGYGLGLAFCQRMVDGLNGQIHVRSQLGKGTTFVVTLPDSRLTS